jgi:hypothetical protein
MKRSLLVCSTVFLAVGCAHQLSQKTIPIQVVVNATPEVTRQFDAVALQRMTELAVRHVKLTNPRPIKLTVAINLDSTDELFYQPRERLKSGRTISWKSTFDAIGDNPVHGGAGQQSADEMRAITIRNEKSGRPVVVGSYAIVGEMDAKLEWEPIVLLSTDPQFSGPRAQQQSMRAAAQFLAERVMLLDESLRLHEDRSRGSRN